MMKVMAGVVFVTKFAPEDDDAVPAYRGSGKRRNVTSTSSQNLFMAVSNGLTPPRGGIILLRVPSAIFAQSLRSALYACISVTCE